MDPILVLWIGIAAVCGNGAYLLTGKTNLAWIVVGLLFVTGLIERLFAEAREQERKMYQINRGLSEDD